MWLSSFLEVDNLFFFRSKLFTFIISIITVKQYYYCLPSSSSSTSSSSWDLSISWDTAEWKTMRIKWVRNVFSYWPRIIEKTRSFKWMIKIEFVAYWHTFKYKRTKWNEGEVSCKNVIANFFDRRQVFSSPTPVNFQLLNVISGN